MDKASIAASKLIEDFFAKSPVEPFPKRSIIIGYDEPPKYMYRIVSGSVKVVSYTNTGRERVHYLYKEGELFPLRSLFGYVQHDIAFVAHMNTTAKKRLMTDFRQFIAARPLALYCIVKQQMEVYDRVLNLNMETAEARVAHRLLALADKFGRTEGEQAIIEFPMTIKEFADSVGLSRETTGRIVKKFEKQHMVTMGRYVIMVNPTKLSEVIRS